MRMVEAFLAAESDERTGEIPDLFLRFDIPFLNPAKYGDELREALLSMEQESRVGLAEAGLPANWQCPTLSGGQSDADTFLMVCASLREHYASLCEHLVAVLIPKYVADDGAWLKWLRQTVENAQATHVRIVVLDDARTLALEPLAQALPERVVTQVARLEMGRALEELSKEAGQLNTPGGQFRDLFVRMSHAASKGDTAKTERLGAQAVELAHSQGWHPLVVTAHFVMGSALLATQKPQEALSRYQQAETAAAAAEEQGNPQGATLRLKSRMAQGAALVATEQYTQAATLYQGTASLAHELKDPPMELECWRMASWCREMAREPDQAWALSQRAWEVGSSMNDEARASSTLPYVGEALLRLGRGRPGEHELESSIASVLGEDWRPKNTKGGQAS
ncbi:hypothetical protein DB31_3308 [Hyalangium minutum]|uniref:MalT-like TPR region domain-containing protein n=1 Tax=Hyalangium minutum TaxID=394096 RepID=A0A085WU15_9BACT|nr:hypothetical protein DB31_3308 [Hyalangium minutum]